MKKIKEKIISLGLSLKKEILFLIIGNLIILSLIVVPFLYQNLILLFPVTFFLVIYNFFFFYRYKTMEKDIRKNDLREFVYLFNFFRIYIRNGYSVYSSLKEIRAFASISLGEMLDELINEMDDDKSVTPFVKFARKLDDLVIEEMMISIYQMIDDGNNSAYLEQFELIFDKYSSIMQENELKNKESRLNAMSYGPLIGSGFLIIMVTVGVVSVIGEMINGL